MSDFAARWLPLLRSLPVPLAALLMQQVLRYDRMFPPEQREIEHTLETLKPPRSTQVQSAVDAFGGLRLSEPLRSAGWETRPTLWTEQITAEMWSTGQIAAFREAARQVLPAQPTDDAHAQARAVVVIFDALLRSESTAPALFRRLLPLGTHFTAVDDAAPHATDRWLRDRAAVSPRPYEHWIISGKDMAPGLASAASQAPAVAALSYAELQPARRQLLRMMNEARNAQGGGGPEGMRDALRALTPQQMGLPPATDLVLTDFATDVLVNGSGTQLYATTFVQWTAREALRRAQPRTLLAHFTSRNQSASMDLRLSEPNAEPPLDPAGSLVDAEMGAHLTWINLQRLPGAERAHFLAWHPGYGQALLIGKGVTPGAQVTARTPIESLLRLMA